MSNPLFFSPESVMLGAQRFRRFLRHDEIQARLDVLCAELNARYAGQNPLFVALLNGSFVLAADVVRRMTTPCEITFAKLKSYSGQQSSGNVKTLIGLEIPLEGRAVILLEDILDTGRTLAHFIPQLRAQNPASLEVLTLLRKPEAALHAIDVQYLGFDVPNLFLIGYGLDADNQGRQYADIYQLDTEA